MGLLDWMKKSRARQVHEKGGSGSKPVETEKPSRTHSIFSDYPNRVLKTEADVRKDDALLEMTLVVNEIANDPDTNWGKYKGDFEKAASGMRAAFEPGMHLPNEEKNRESREVPLFSPAPSVKASDQPFERGDRIIAHEPFYYGGKLKANPETPGIVDGVYDNGKRVSYERLGNPPSSTSIEHVRHATANDLNKYADKFATLAAKLQQPEKGRRWDR